MPTNFKPILDLKKSEVDKQEQAIMHTNSLIAEKQNEIYDILAQISALDFPTNGNNYQAYLGVLAHKNALISLMDELNADLANLKAQKVSQQQLYKYLQVEYEKFKYLDTKQREQHLKALKRAQQNELDEIAIMLFKKDK